MSLFNTSGDVDNNNNGIPDGIDLQVLINLGFPGDDNDQIGLFPEGFCIDKGNCTEGQNCSQNFDCLEEDNLKCNTDDTIFEDVTRCFDVTEAERWITITQIAVPAAALLLAIHVVLTFYLELKTAWKSARRAAKKRRKDKGKKIMEASPALESMRFGNFGAYKSEVFTELYDSEDEEGNVTQKTLERRKSEVLRQAETQRRRYEDQLLEMLDSSQAAIARVREEAGIVRMNSKILSPLRMKVATQLRILVLMFLKRKTLVGWKDDEIRDALDSLDRVGVMLQQAEEGGIKEGDAVLNDALRSLSKLDRKLTKKLRDQELKNWDLSWDLSDPKFQHLQSKVYMQIRPDDPYYEEMAKVANTNFTEQENIMKEVKKQGGRRRACKVCVRRFVKCFIPSFLYHYPIFYFIYYLTTAVIIGAFIFRMGDYEDNDDLQQGGVRGTFLPIPNYYDLQNNVDDNYLIPLLYGFMHCALFNLCLIPVPMTRGFLRDLSLAFPSLRQFGPIDDAYWFHKFVAVHLLSYLLLGAFIFAFHIGNNCLDETKVTGQACFGFDPQPPANIVANNFAINPVQNVYMLRKIVWMTWFTVFPMLHWANTVPKWAPRFLKRYWYEIWYYSHHLIAHTSAFLALIARFEVFFPTLAPWGLYYLDKMREATMKTAKSEILVRPVFVAGDVNPDDAMSSTVHIDDKGMPNSMRLLIEVPPGFKVNAGQWIYLKVPSISRIQWHPFSLASASRDLFVELHIGIRGDKSQWKKRKGNTDDPWYMYKSPTWTYKLYREVRKRIHEMATLEDPERQADQVDPLFCKIRGPYGSTFTKCFDPHYYGSIIIGAGTGLTAAESVLRELLWRKRQRQRVPKYTWFVWSCRRVDDLLWAWGSLHDLLVTACKDEVLRPGKRWSEASLMLDWLGVYLYISRADKAQLEDFKESISTSETERRASKIERSSKVSEAEDLESQKKKKEGATFNVNLTDSEKLDQLSVTIHKWMSHDNRMFTQSMDDKKAHIEKLFAWVRLFVNRKAGKHKKIALCFCGPGGLAHTLSRAAEKIGGSGSMQFSADSQ